MAQSPDEARDQYVSAALNTMLAQEEPAKPVELVDILSGSDDSDVTFTAAWETDT